MTIPNQPPNHHTPHTDAPPNMDLVIAYTQAIITLRPFETLTLTPDVSYREVRLRLPIDPIAIGSALRHYDLDGCTVTCARFHDDHVLIVIVPEDAHPLTQWARQEDIRRGLMERERADSPAIDA